MNPKRMQGWSSSLICLSLGLLFLYIHINDLTLFYTEFRYVHKKAWRPSYCPIHFLKYLQFHYSWTGNVTANADMNNRSITQSSRHISKTLKRVWRFSIWLVLLLGYLYKQLYCARKVRSVLIRSTQEWYDHTRDIYRCLAQDQNPICCKIRLVSNTTSSERLHYV